MPEFALKVEALGIGARSNSRANKCGVDRLEFTLEGVNGDGHGGFTKPADGRDRGVRRGTIIQNWRQWSAVSMEELSMIAKRLNIGELDGMLLGANIVFSGHVGFTLIPKGSMIWFESGLVLVVAGENAPCTKAGKELAKHFPKVEPSQFPKAARQLRGLVGTVYRAGTVKAGDSALVSVYEPFDALSKPPSDKRFTGPTNNE